jgi:hypothetical protein
MASASFFALYFFLVKIEKRKGISWFKLIPFLVFGLVNIF